MSVKSGSRFTAVSGFVLSALGLWQISRWPVDVGAFRQTVDLLAAGFGFGLVIAPLSLSVINSVSRKRMAAGAAVLTATRIIGMTAGLAAINSWGISQFQANRGDDPVPLPRLGMSLGNYLEVLKLWEQRNVEVILRVLSDFFLIAAAACVLAIVPSLFLVRKKRTQG